MKKAEWWRIAAAPQLYMDMQATCTACAKGVLQRFNGVCIPSSTPSFSPFSAFFLVLPKGEIRRENGESGLVVINTKWLNTCQVFVYAKCPTPRSNFFIFIFSPQASSPDFRPRPLSLPLFRIQPPLFRFLSFSLSYLKRSDNILIWIKQIEISSHNITITLEIRCYYNLFSLCLQSYRR